MCLLGGTDYRSRSFFASLTTSLFLITNITIVTVYLNLGYKGSCSYIVSFSIVSFVLRLEVCWCTGCLWRKVYFTLTFLKVFDYDNLNTQHWVENLLHPWSEVTGEILFTVLTHFLLFLSGVSSSQSKHVSWSIRLFWWQVLPTWIFKKRINLYYNL